MDKLYLWLEIWKVTFFLSNKNILWKTNIYRNLSCALPDQLAHFLALHGQKEFFFPEVMEKEIAQANISSDCIVD